MSKGNTFENELLEHIFNNADIANIGDATGLRGSSAAGSLYVALHTADPGEGGDQSSNEATYTSYARQAVSRAGADWTVTGNSCSPAADIVFPQATGGSETITHVSIGTSMAGAGKILYYGALTPTIAVSNGVQPIIDSSSTITED